MVLFGPGGMNRQSKILQFFFVQIRDFFCLRETLILVRSGSLDTWINLPRLYPPRFYLPRFYLPRFNPGRFYPPRLYPPRFYPGRLIYLDKI